MTTYYATRDGIDSGSRGSHSLYSLIDALINKEKEDVIYSNDGDGWQPFIRVVPTKTIHEIIRIV